MKFKDLDIGDTFDFVDPNANITHRSFYERCTKRSPRKYSWRDLMFVSQVGSINVEVFNVQKNNLKIKRRGNQINLREVSQSDYDSMIRGLYALVGSESINDVPLIFDTEKEKIPLEKISLMITVHNNQVIALCRYSRTDPKFFTAETFEPGQIKRE